MFFYKNKIHQLDIFLIIPGKRNAGPGRGFRGRTRRMAEAYVKTYQVSH